MPGSSVAAAGGGFLCLFQMVSGTVFCWPRLLSAHQLSLQQFFRSGMDLLKDDRNSAQRVHCLASLFRGNSSVHESPLSCPDADLRRCLLGIVCMAKETDKAGYQQNTWRRTAVSGCIFLLDISVLFPSCGLRHGKIYGLRVHGRHGPQPLHAAERYLVRGRHDQLLLWRTVLRCIPGKTQPGIRARCL